MRRVIDVVLPVLNEAEALPWVLRRMPAWGQAIVVDNGSSDGSAGIAAGLGAEVVGEPLPGFSSACFAGLEAARSEIVCFMDCDGSLDPRDLWRVADPVRRGEADLVLGRRMPEPGAWPLHARLANRAIARVIGRRIGVQLHDLGPMRAAPRHALGGLSLQDRRSGWPFEMVLTAGAAGWRIEETPVPYLMRMGRSKVTGTLKGTARATRDLGRVLRCA